VTASDEGLYSRALRALVEEYSATVLVIARAHSNDEDEANEVAQAIWLRIVDVLPSRKPTAPMEAWIRRTATNAARSARGRRLGWGKLKAHVRETSAAEPSRRSSDAGSMEEGARATVQRAVGQLSPQRRAVVQLRIFEGFSTADTAVRLDLAQGTVKKTLHEAMKCLRPVLEHLGDLWKAGDIERTGDPL